ncbi:MAG: hypothetical protein EDM75_12065 [Chlorobiota bacterium]|nr:MAG: hypothetical protein EDM75_12065 [Chlorobiota bacterium]
MIDNRTLKSAAFFSLLLFAATLTNALFFNQLGYYVALVLLGIARFRGEKEVFRKNGLEPWLLLFVAAEVLALIFSDNKLQALEFAFKRVILLPIIYTVAAGINDARQLRTFFYTYLVFALGSDLLYIGFSIEYFVRDLYKFTSEGPSVLLHPITTGELTSFTALYLFSLFLNEERKKWKIGWLVMSLISMASLLATFKRTAWIGLGLGLLVLLFMNRNYILITAGAVVAIIVVLMAGNESRVFIYDLKGTEVAKFETEGLAYKVQPLGDELVISDYNDGLKIYKRDSLVSRLETPAPIYEIVKWGDKYAAFLNDYRILLLSKNEKGFSIEKEFTSPGYLGRLAVNRGMLYAVDSDSGITIYKDPASIEAPLRFPRFTRGMSMMVDSSYININYSDYTHTTVRLDPNGYPVDTIAYDRPVPQGSKFLAFKGGKLLYYFDKGFKLADPVTGKIKDLPPNTDCKGIAWNTVATGTDSLYIVGIDKNLYSVKIEGDTSVYLSLIRPVGKYPFSLSASEKYICMTDIKRSRVLSFFDMTGETNRNRLAMWRIGWEIFLDHPLFGVGDIDLAKIFKEYNRPYEKEIKGHLHNNFFHLLATLGGFGIISVVMLFVMMIRKNLQVFRKTPARSFERALVMGAMASFASFIGAGLTEFNFGDHEIITMVWFSAGVTFAVLKQLQNKENDRTV